MKRKREVLFSSPVSSERAELADQQMEAVALRDVAGVQPTVTNGALSENTVNVLLNFEIKEVRHEQWLQDALTLRPLSQVVSSMLMNIVNTLFPLAITPLTWQHVLHSQVQLSVYCQNTGEKKTKSMKTSRTTAFIAFYCSLFCLTNLSYFYCCFV